MKRIRGFLILGIVIVVAAALYALRATHPDFHVPSCRDFAGELSSMGMKAPLYFLFLAVVSMLLFIPRTVSAVAAGMLFGFWGGVLWSTVASAIGAMAAFYFSRFLAREWVLGILKDRPWFQKLWAGTKTNSFYLVAFSRLVHVFNFNGANLAWGLLPTTTAQYFWGTFLGIIPGTLFLCYAGKEFGCAFLEGSFPHSQSWEIAALLVGICLAFSALIPIWLKRRRS